MFMGNTAKLPDWSERPLAGVDEPGCKNLLAAMTYCKYRGYRLVPVHYIDGDRICSCGGNEGCRPGKHPMLSDWTARATQDATLVSEFWTATPDAGIGVVCGRGSGIVVLDIDPRNGGDETLAAFIREFGDLPETPEVFTGGGGRHFYFRYPEGTGSCRTRVLGPGLELRGDDALVVAPPTVHMSGKRYLWNPKCHLSNLKPPDAPAWITEQREPNVAPAAVSRRDIASRKRRATAYIVKMDAAISGRGGDAQTWRAVLAAVVGFGLDGDDAIAVLEDFNSRCVPPWNPKELRRKIDAAMESDLTRGYLLNAEAGDSSVNLVKNRHGGPAVLAVNVARCLTSNPDYADRLAFDEFENCVVALAPIPGLPTRPGESYPRRWHDVDTLGLAVRLQPELPVATGHVHDGVLIVAMNNRFHPVRDYLSGLVWDGTLRIDDWLVTYAGANGDDSTPLPYLQAVGSKWLISAVARVFKPGCKVDHMLILEGTQGARKSSLFAALAGDWFCDDLPDVNNKDAAIQLAGTWILEIAELDALSRAEATRVKSFLSRSVDKYRPPYGRTAQTFPRQCVFAGTTNGSEYLRDGTGGRRFWPVTAGKMDIAAVTRDRDQLWAEAVHRFRSGEPWWITDAETVSMAEGEQERRYHSDPWEAPIAKYVERGEGDPEIAISDILRWGLELSEKDVSPAHTKRVVTILNRLGFSKVRPRGPEGKRRYVYKRGA